LEREKISTRINATYKTCHVTYQLEISSAHLITASCPPNQGAGSESGFVIGEQANWREKRFLCTRIKANYRACHVTYQLRISSIHLILATQSGRGILNQDLLLVSQNQIHGRNFKQRGQIN
jgi:hypothetical protein